MSKAYLALQVAIVNFFANKAEMDAFLATPHSSFDNLPPGEWFNRTRRRDRLEFTVQTITELRSQVIAPAS